MSKLSFTAVLLCLFVINQNAFCQSIDHDNQRVSITGAIFTRDTSNPALGEAYMDPSGLIWGQLISPYTNVEFHYSREAAIEFCNNAGARLPAKEDFEQLARYLGKDTSYGYSPYVADGTKEILPGLIEPGNSVGNALWTTSIYAPYSFYVFHGSSGTIMTSSRGQYSLFHYARCVSGR